MNSLTINETQCALLLIAADRVIDQWKNLDRASSVVDGAEYEKHLKGLEDVRKSLRYIRPRIDKEHGGKYEFALFNYEKFAFDAILADLIEAVDPMREALHEILKSKGGK